MVEIGHPVYNADWIRTIREAQATLRELDAGNTLLSLVDVEQDSATPTGRFLEEYSGHRDNGAAVHAYLADLCRATEAARRADARQGKLELA